MPRLRKRCRCGSELYPRSPWTIFDLRSGRPRLPRMGGIASTSSSSCVMSLQFAPVQDDRERDVLRVDDRVMLAAELAPVRWVRTGFFPASMARTEELSTMARAMSSWPRRRNSASSISWMRCQTPASCHATRRRQHAVPEPQPISCGSRFQAMPERSANTMPVSTARSDVGLRPAYRRLRGARAGNNGSMSDHSSSSINSPGVASCQAKQDRKLTPARKS